MSLFGSVSMDDLRLFFLVHEGGGISAAARRFGISKATLSRALARLEEQAGTPLFDRISTGLRPTQIGLSLLRVASDVTRAGSDAEEVLRAAQGEPKGTLRIAASALSAQQLLGPVIARLAERHPQVRPSVTITGHGPDPLAEDLDVVLRLGRPVEPYLIARRVISARLRLYAPAAAAGAMDLTRAEAVEALGRIVIDVPGSPTDWVLADAAGRELRFDGPPMCIVGDPTVALGILRAGRGVALLPSVYGEARVMNGDFARALPELEGPPVEVFATFPPRRASVPAVRAFIDLLVETADAMPR